MIKVGSDELGEVLGLTQRRIEQFVHAGMPRLSRGTYDLAACVQWYVSYRLSRSASHTTLHEERLKLLQVERALKSLELKKALAQLVPVEEYSARMRERIASTRQRLLALPARIALRLDGDPAKNKTLLVAAMREACESMKWTGSSAEATEEEEK